MRIDISKYPSDSELIRLANYDVDAILDWLNSGVLKDADLSFAIEIAGNCIKDTNLIEPTIIKLLQHETPAVREGALNACEKHLKFSETLRRRVEYIAYTDQNETICKTAQQILKWNI